MWLIIKNKLSNMLDYIKLGLYKFINFISFGFLDKLERKNHDLAKSLKKTKNKNLVLANTLRKTAHSLKKATGKNYKLKRDNYKLRGNNYKLENAIKQAKNKKRLLQKSIKQAIEKIITLKATVSEYKAYQDRLKTLSDKITVTLSNRSSFSEDLNFEKLKKRQAYYVQNRTSILKSFKANPQRLEAISEQFKTVSQRMLDKKPHDKTSKTPHLTYLEELKKFLEIRAQSFKHPIYRIKSPLSLSNFERADPELLCVLQEANVRAESSPNSLSSRSSSSFTYHNDTREVSQELLTALQRGAKLSGLTK